VTSRLPWLRVTAEGTAIVVSILLAFGIQAWWEGRQQQTELRQLLLLLDTELTRNSRLLEASIAAHDEILAAIEWTVREGSTSVHARPSNPFAAVEVFNPTTGALDALTSSGALGIMEDVELRVLITSLPGLVADLAEKEERATTRREHVRSRVAAKGVRIGDLPPGPRGEPTEYDLPDGHPFFTPSSSTSW